MDLSSLDKPKKEKGVEAKRYRGATISVVSNGFIIKIGCQTVVAESAQSLMELIAGYLNDPAGTEKRLLRDSLMFENLIPQQSVSLGSFNLSDSYVRGSAGTAESVQVGSR